MALRVLLFLLVLLLLERAEGFTTGLRNGATMSSKGLGTSSIALPASQVLEFDEPTTGVRVVLVGAMHYNPSSIRLAKDTIEGLGEENRLGSVVVEACDLRWNKTATLYEEKPYLKKLLNNEMRTACDAAFSYNRPVVLGDQRINTTVDALKASFKETLRDLATPWGGGWGRFTKEVSEGWREARPFVLPESSASSSSTPSYLSPFAFFDAGLLLAFPVSLIKYPLSYFVRDPIPTTVFLGGLLGLSFLDPTDPTSLVYLGDAIDFTSESAGLSDWLLSIGFAGLETAVFARLLLKPLLAERNEILAESIRKQCEIYAADSSSSSVVGGASSASKGGFPSWFPFPFQETAVVTEDATKTLSTEIEPVIYAPGGPTGEQNSESTGDRVVVAVLGMAHCNGIKQILTSE